MKKKLLIIIIVLILVSIIAFVLFRITFNDNLSLDIINVELTEEQIKKLSKEKIVTISTENEQYIEGSYLSQECALLNKYGKTLNKSAKDINSAYEIAQNYLNSLNSEYDNMYCDLKLSKEREYMYEYEFSNSILSDSIYNIYIFKDSYFQIEKFNSNNINKEDIKKIGDILLYFYTGNLVKVINTSVNEDENNYHYTAYLIYGIDEYDDLKYKTTEYTLDCITFDVDKETGEYNFELYSGKDTFNVSFNYEILEKFDEVKKNKKGSFLPV